MKLLSLQIKDIGNIEAAEMQFDGKGVLIPIVGDNEAGKSSVINALEYIFSGGKNIPNSAVRNGCDKGEVVAITEGYRIRRIIKEAGSPVLEVKTEEGAVMPSPQKFLDTLSAKFPDPHTLSELKTDDLYKVLLGYADIDLEEIDTDIKVAEKTRVEKKHEMDKIGNPSPVDNVEPVSVEALYTEKEKVTEVTNALKTANAKMKEVDDGIAELEEKLAALRDRKKKGEEIIASLKTKVTGRPVEEIEADIQNVKEINEKALLYQDYLSRKKQYEALDEAWHEYDVKIKEKRAERERLLKEKFPLVDDMVLNEQNEILVNGIPWESLSTSQRLLYGVKLGMKISPKLKCMYIKRGESILSRKLKELETLATENDYTILMEMAREEKPDTGTGFYIESGIISSYGKENT